jgi:hypothetical protein
MPLYCCIRKHYVAATPEEQVRQSLLSYMIQQLQFPPQLLAVEKALDQMPHLAVKPNLPTRRADILCFGQGIHPLNPIHPLLLIECKAVPLSDEVVRQTTGYNHYLQAYFVCMANQKHIRTGWFDPVQKTYRFIEHLPPYPELLRVVPRTV